MPCSPTLVRNCSCMCRVAAGGKSVHKSAHYVLNLNQPASRKSHIIYICPCRPCCTVVSAADSQELHRVCLMQLAYVDMLYHHQFSSSLLRRVSQAPPPCPTFPDLPGLGVSLEGQQHRVCSIMNSSSLKHPFLSHKMGIFVAWNVQ